MVTWVNGMVVWRTCWLATLVRKSVIWLSMPRISFGPALVKLFSRLAPPPRLVLKATCTAGGPEASPKRFGMVMVSVADAPFMSDPPTFTPGWMLATIGIVTGVVEAVRWTFDGVSSARSSLPLLSVSWVASAMLPPKWMAEVMLRVASRRLRLMEAVMAGMTASKLAHTGN